MGLSAFNAMRARLAKEKAELEKSKAKPEPVVETVEAPKVEPVKAQPDVPKTEKKAEQEKKTDAQKLRRKKG